MKTLKTPVSIVVYADWKELNGCTKMGILHAEMIRGKQIFSFEYDSDWLRNKQQPFLLDPDLSFFAGPQYIRDDKPNFGLFLDSSPDRWGRVLLERRERLLAKEEARAERALSESDYLLGVFDLYRMGGLRFKTEESGPFLDDNDGRAAPPFTRLRELEAASRHLEEEAGTDNPKLKEWLAILMQPGASLGGARPKASVMDTGGQLWIAKFPSIADQVDSGGWEKLVNDLAGRAGLNVAEGEARRFTGSHHSFLTKRFDREGHHRLHFASAMTLLNYKDGADASSGASYLDIAEFIMRHGARVVTDLEELWRRIVFNICISNTDDHLRNHGFLLTPKGWVLSPAYDMNPVARSTGLSLNISETSNALELDLAREVAELFRIFPERREEIIDQVTRSVSYWHEIAGRLSISRGEMEQMEAAFSMR